MKRKLIAMTLTACIVGAIPGFQVFAEDMTTNTSLDTSTNDEVNVSLDEENKTTTDLDAAVVINPTNFDMLPINTTTFEDVSTTDWYYDAVVSVTSKGLMRGTASNLFSPYSNTTKAMLVTILYNLEGTPEIETLSSYSDVNNEEYYAKAIAWATQSNLVPDLGNNIFGTYVDITREQLTSILYNYAKYKGYGFKGNWMFLLDMNDRELISDSAYESVCWMNMNGIIAGKENKMFDPQGLATRADLAVILTNFCKLVQ